jgi:hypothetical protein
VRARRRRGETALIVRPAPRVKEGVVVCGCGSRLFAALEAWPPLLRCATCGSLVRVRESRPGIGGALAAAAFGFLAGFAVAKSPRED